MRALGRGRTVAARTAIVSEGRNHALQVARVYDRLPSHLRRSRAATRYVRNTSIAGVPWATTVGSVSARPCRSAKGRSPPFRDLPNRQRSGPPESNPAKSSARCRVAGLDPLLPFKFVPMDGRNAQIAVIPRRGKKRVKSNAKRIFCGSDARRCESAPIPSPSQPVLTACYYLSINSIVCSSAAGETRKRPV